MSLIPIPVAKGKELELDIRASIVTVDQKRKKRIEHLCGPQSTRELPTQETTQDVNAERRR